MVPVHAQTILYYTEESHFLAFGLAAFLGMLSVKAPWYLFARNPGVMCEQAASTCAV